MLYGSVGDYRGASVYQGLKDSVHPGVHLSKLGGLSGVCMGKHPGLVVTSTY